MVSSFPLRLIKITKKLIAGGNKVVEIISVKCLLKLVHLLGQSGKCLLSAGVLYKHYPFDN